MITKVRASITAGIRPTAVVLGHQPGDDWTEADFKLLLAYQTIQDETCPVCGQFLWLCRSEDPNLQFEVRTSTCNADKSLEKWRESQSKKNKNKSAPPGERPYAVPYLLTYSDSGVPERVYDVDKMPSREDYYQALAAQHGG